VRCVRSSRCRRGHQEPRGLGQASEPAAIS
jgi:hypothetical protein